HTTRIEDDHPVAQMTDDIEIVGDEQIAQRELTLKLLQEVENLRLHREIESARRLVEDDELGREHEGSCDRDALPLTPGKLSRVAILGIRRKMHPLEHRANSAPDVIAPRHVEGFQRLGERPPDLTNRVERAVRILEDDLDVAIEHAPFPERQVRDVGAVESNGSSLRGRQAEDGSTDRRLPGAGLADEPDRLAPRNGEAHAVERLHDRTASPVADRHVVQLEQRTNPGHACTATISSTRMQRVARLSESSCSATGA